VFGWFLVRINECYLSNNNYIYVNQKRYEFGIVSGAIDDGEWIELGWYSGAIISWIEGECLSGIN